MTRWTRYIPLVAAGLVLAACGADPVGSSGDPLDGVTPRMDGGYGTGGSATGDGSGSPTMSTSETDDGTATLPSDSTSRGGYATGGS